MSRNQLTKRNRKQTKKHSMKRRGAKWYIANLVTMSPQWTNIHNQLKATHTAGHITCACCNNIIGLDSLEYISVLNPKQFAARKPNKIIVHSYKLSSALRTREMWTNYNVLQPTIFYFHCPTCSFLYQFRSGK